MPRIDTGTCKTCEQEFRGPRSGDGTPRKYCSQSCYRRQPQTAARIANRVAKTIQTRTRTNTERKFLGIPHPLKGHRQSEDHKNKRATSLKETLASTIRQCTHCGESFTPTLAAQRYCSGRCWQSVARKRKKPEDRISIPRTEYRRLLEEQEYKCAICGKQHQSNGTRDSLSVDHCHETKIVRGLLCHRCNTAIGLLRDSPDLMGNAIRYIKRFKVTA